MPTATIVGILGFSYIFIRIGFSQRYKQRQYGAVWTVRTVGVVGLIVGIGALLNHFELTYLKDFYINNKEAITIFGTIIIAFVMLFDAFLLIKSGKTALLFNSRKKPLEIFTWDVWLVILLIILLNTFIFTR